MCGWRNRGVTLTDKEAAEIIRAVRRDVVDAYAKAIQEKPAYTAEVLNTAIHMSVDALMMRQGLADSAASARLNSEQLRRDYQDLEQDTAAVISAADALDKQRLANSLGTPESSYLMEIKLGLALRAALAAVRKEEKGD